MSKYVALLRGIGPGNPNMRNDKLRGVFEGLGFANVKTVISSGNVIFESPESDIAALEAKIEKALPERLDFTSTTIIRSREQLQQLFDKNLFKNLEHSPKTYLTVTFLKHAPANTSSILARGANILGMHNNAIFSIVDTTAAKTPDLMAQLDRHYGKQITTRTYKTVERILKVMG